MIFSTEVEDRDFDGLLDVWETGDDRSNPPTRAPLLEPAGTPLPNLRGMGASPDVHDIFVEVGFMEDLTAGGYDTPLGHVNPHTHLPGQPVLNDMRQRSRMRAFVRILPTLRKPSPARSRFTSMSATVRREPQRHSSQPCTRRGDHPRNQDL